MSAQWPTKYLSIPFVDGGRDSAGLDCWGLVALVLKEQCGIHVPPYGEISSEQLIEIARQMETDTKQPEVWLTAIAPREFDVVVMSWFGKKIIGHVGIMIDGKRLLHTEKGAEVMVVDVKHKSIEKRVRGFYRHRELIDATV